MTSVVPFHPVNRHAARHRHLRRHDPAATLAAAVGNTPVLRITAPFTDDHRGFWAKLEGFNPGGIKDRPAMHMVERARARGDLRPGAPIIESSSGTLGLGLALAGMVYRHPVTVVTDIGLEPIVARMLAAYGVQVQQVTEPHPEGGQQAGVEIFLLDEGADPVEPVRQETGVPWGRLACSTSDRRLAGELARHRVRAGKPAIDRDGLPIDIACLSNYTVHSM